MNATLPAKLVTGAANPDHHIVVAAIGGRADQRFLGYAVVSAPMSYSEALKVWDRKTANRGLFTHVLWYAVRSVADPRFAPLVSTGYGDRYEGKAKAARAWAKKFGYVGKQGGWIYRPSGEVFCQGWLSLADSLIRQSKIAQGEDGRWYVLDHELVP